MNRALPVLTVVLVLALVAMSPVQAQDAGVRALAARLGADVQEDPVTGLVTLRAHGHVVRLAPGIDRVLFDDRVETLTAAPVQGRFDLMVPAGAVAGIEGWLRAPERAPATAGTARARTPAPARAPVRSIGKGGRIVIDPGHGGPHTGTKGAHGSVEKTVVLDISRRLQALLQQQGWQVHMTRTDDRALSSNVRTDLNRRAEFTQKLHPDVFVSIHANHATTSGVRGCEVFVGRGGSATRHDTASRRIARELEAGLRGLGLPSRGVKEAGFYVIKNANCPAVLVETEFLSNGVGEKILQDPAWRQRYAEAMAGALDDYRRAHLVRP